MFLDKNKVSREFFMLMHNSGLFVFFFYHYQSQRVINSPLAVVGPRADKLICFISQVNIKNLCGCTLRTLRRIAPSAYQFEWEK